MKRLYTIEFLGIYFQCSSFHYFSFNKSYSSTRLFNFLGSLMIVGILCVFLIGCSKTNEPTAPQIDVENVDTLADSIVEFSDFLSYFVEKTYAPKSQTDIDTAVGNAVDIIDPTALFYFLRSLPKEINKESYVDISQVSYDLSEPNPSIIIRFELYLSTKYSTPKYVRFDFNEDNMITNIQEYYIK